VKESEEREKDQIEDPGIPSNHPKNHLVESNSQPCLS